MYSFASTIHQLNKQPGRCARGGMNPSIAKRLTRMDVCVGVHPLFIANEQINSYESDLGMT